MAGKVKAKYGDGVNLEIINPGERMEDGNPDSPQPPNITVDGEVLGKRVTLQQLDRLVADRLKQQ
ncbi:MAG: hypothetical protein H0Z39_10405 [Peptococcaceae bacterium]|nr:hypothetical protein [Peptococcaceae bacterium]